MGGAGQHRMQRVAAGRAPPACNRDGVTVIVGDASETGERVAGLHAAPLPSTRHWKHEL